MGIKYIYKPHHKICAVCAFKSWSDYCPKIGRFVVLAAWCKYFKIDARVEQQIKEMKEAWLAKSLKKESKKYFKKGK